MRRAKRVASEIKDDLGLAATRRIEHAGELCGQQLHPGHQPYGTRHLAEKLRRLSPIASMHRVGQHQHLARIDALGTGGYAFTASISRVRESCRRPGQWRAMREKNDYAVRDSFRIGVLEPGGWNPRAYFDALAARRAGA